jgi:thymidylate synthase (FAD)
MNFLNTFKVGKMKATYENHYLTDKDVANFARHSFEKLADNFTTDQNNNLIRFLARGMATKDWEAMLWKLANSGHGVLCETASIESIKELAVYLRNIPEHWVPFGHPQITLRMSAPVPIRTQC